MRRRLLSLALALTVASTAVAWAWATWVIEEPTQWSLPSELLAAKRPVLIREVKLAGFQSDRGVALPVYLAAELPDPQELDDVDAFVTAPYAEHLVRKDDAGLAYNCHGWVFTGGEYWVQSEVVDGILRDNGYQQVEQPRPGDLVVYRDETMPVHSGVVDSIQDGCVLVESKWGKAGRFVHPVEAQRYSHQFAYYRSPRTGHFLHRPLQTNVPGLPPIVQ